MSKEKFNTAKNADEELTMNTSEKRKQLICKEEFNTAKKDKLRVKLHSAMLEKWGANL